MARILRSSGSVHESSKIVSFLVAAPGNLCAEIADILHESAKRREDGLRIVVHQCERLDTVLRSVPDLSVDFIVFAFDPRVEQTLLQVESNIALVDEFFLTFGCCCVLNCAVGNYVAETVEKSNQMCLKYNIRFLSVDISDIDNVSLLGDRILNIASAKLGLRSKIPMPH